MSLVALARQRLAEWETSGTASGTRAEQGLKQGPFTVPCSAVPRPRERNNGTAASVRNRPFSGPVFHPFSGETSGTASGTRAEQALPNDWREGLASLNPLTPPPGAHPRRWERSVADAIHLGETWAPQAYALGWRDVDLWGCDPDGSRRLDRDGLAMLLHGRPVLAMTETAATIATPGGRTLSYYRAPLIGAVPMWAIQPAFIEE